MRRRSRHILSESDIELLLHQILRLTRGEGSPRCYENPGFCDIIRA